VADAEILKGEDSVSSLSSFIANAHNKVFTSTEKAILKKLPRPIGDWTVGGPRVYGWLRLCSKYC